MTESRRFFGNALWLSFTAFTMRGIGVLYNRCLSTLVGAAGLGQISLVLSVYGFAVTLAASGLHLAVTRTVSEAAARGRTAEAVCARRTGLLCGSILGCLSAVLLYTASPWIGKTWFSDASVVPALRTLALSLPFLSLSTTLGGLFTARRQAGRGALIGLCGQLVRVGVSLLFLRYVYLRGISSAVMAPAAAALISELLCFLLSLLLLLPKPAPHRKKEPLRPLSSEERRTARRYFLHILLPVLCAACVRSGLQTLQHLLIPVGLGRFGLSSEEALSAYGTVHGMALPVLLFPSAILTSCAGLLIPEVCSMCAAGDEEAVRRTARRALRLTLCFSVFCAGVLFFNADRLCTLVYNSADAGRYLAALAPLLPVMYLDTAVDAMLKSLDAQMASMRYNLYDAAFCVLLTVTLLPLCGINGYVILLYSAEGLNLALSLHKLLTLVDLHIPIGQWIGKPLLAVIGARCTAGLLLSLAGITFRFALSALVCELLLCAMLFCLFLYGLGGYTAADGTMFLRMFSPAQKLPLAKDGASWYNRGKFKRKGQHTP